MEDPWDKRLLYEVTGMRINEKDYRGDDTSSDEDADLLDRQNTTLLTKMRQMDSLRRESFDIDKFD